MNKIIKSKSLKKLYGLLSTLICIMMIFNINAFALPASTEEQFLQKLQPFFKEYGLILNVFIAVVVLTNLLIFIYHFCKLGAQACDHPLIRRQVLQDLMISGVCLALIGGAGSIYVILFSIIMK